MRMNSIWHSVLIVQQEMKLGGGGGGENVWGYQTYLTKYKKQHAYKVKAYVHQVILEEYGSLSSYYLSCQELLKIKKKMNLATEKERKKS